MGTSHWEVNHNTGDCNNTVKQGFEELCTQQLIEGNISRLKSPS